jgi:hypothetical protein
MRITELIPYYYYLKKKRVQVHNFGIKIMGKTVFYKSIHILSHIHIE